jgi:hypothetical protein
MDCEYSERGTNRNPGTAVQYTNVQRTDDRTENEAGIATIRPLCLLCESFDAGD